jgi:hypothetical protein
VPAPQPPVILVDNVFDRINLYPQATLLGDPAVVGREVNYAADYRRERTYYQAASAASGRLIGVDLGVTNTAQPDACWVDRGHNLWGKTIHILAQDELSHTVGVQYIFSRVVPALGTVGGDPTSAWCVTEEGALYTLFPDFLTAMRFFYFSIVESLAPQITGIVLGKRVQLLNYSSVRDEDAGGRTERTTESDAAYQAVERVYAYRTLQLSLDLIGAAEYDASIRSLRSTLFERNQPAFIVMNYGDKPERGWLMQYQGKSWSSPMTRVHRKWTGTFREVGALIR